jgi:hypothetical protein
LPQTSKIKKCSLGSPGPKASSHKRVPRPIICQNFE